MIFAEAQKEGDVSELQMELKTAEKAKWYRRLKIVQLSMAGQSVPELAQTFDVCQATVRDYIKAYNAGGLEALAPKTSPGRPPKVGQLSRDDWQAILSKTPNSYDRLDTDDRQWNLNHLVRYAKEYLGQEVCFQTISAAMRRCGYRTGRSKLRVGSPSPDYQTKRQTIETLRNFRSRVN